VFFVKNIKGTYTVCVQTADFLWGFGKWYVYLPECFNV